MKHRPILCLLHRYRFGDGKNEYCGYYFEDEQDGFLIECKKLIGTTECPVNHEKKG